MTASAGLGASPCPPGERAMVLANGLVNCTRGRLPPLHGLGIAQTPGGAGVFGGGRSGMPMRGGAFRVRPGMGAFPPPPVWGRRRRGMGMIAPPGPCPPWLRARPLAEGSRRGGCAGLGDLLWDTGEGVFHGRGQQGGGVFSSSLAGLGMLGDVTGTMAGTGNLGNVLGIGADVGVPDPAAQQKALNVFLDAAGYCPIKVDGKIGADTCAAATAVGAPLSVNCKMAGITGGSAPKKKPNCASSGGGGYVAPVTVTTAPPTYTYDTGSSIDWKKWGAFGVGGIAAIGLVLYMKKRKRGG